MSKTRLLVEDAYAKEPVTVLVSLALEADVSPEELKREAEIDYNAQLELLHSGKYAKGYDLRIAFPNRLLASMWLRRHGFDDGVDAYRVDS